MKNRTPFRERVWKFMQGRNGPDAYYSFLMIVCIVLIVVGMFLRGIAELIVSFLYLSVMFYAIFRLFSKNLYKRRKENADFLRFVKNFKGFFRLQRDRFRDRKTHVYRKCPSCKAVLRLPKAKGKHFVVCPRCKHRFSVRG